MRYKKLFLIFVLIIGVVFAKGYIPYGYKFPKRASLQSEITDKPADWWMIAWTGVGNLKGWLVSNALQGGVFRQPYTWEYYDGTFPFDALRGEYIYKAVGEYPAGTRQYYSWANGIWVGALYPQVKGKDTVWVPNVSKAAFYSDMGAMSAPELENAGSMGDISGLGLYFSTQRIPKGYGYTGEGNYLFAQPGTTPLDYQTTWPFTDTSINSRRPEGMKLKMGDIVSMEDTYACGGDWIPEDDATVIWIRDTGPYDTWGLGIRIEQRTYSWNYNYNDNIIFINYKIRNMNPFPLRDVYVGYFMDNDIGDAEDDMIGFDAELNLGYTYDSDGYEEGWVTLPGYIGCVLLQTPEDKGLTGFATWLNGDPPDYPGTYGDSAKYEMLATTEYMTWEEPKDVRQLSTSGPYKELLPGEEIEFTVAVMVSLTLEGLKESARIADTLFKMGYVGFSPPPPPNLFVIPGDGKVYLMWDNSPEDFVDPMSGQRTFEGYRVYKSTSGIIGTWELLADYDVKGSTTIDTVMVQYKAPSSKAYIKFEGFEERTKDDLFEDATYTINFIDSTQFILYNGKIQEVYEYNKDAIFAKKGYFIKDPVGDTVYSENPGYVSGAYIYFDGIYISINDGEYDPEQPEADLTPNKGDIFIINTYKASSVGAQSGLRYYYVDDEVKNGMTYYYSVTSYSRPQPEYGVPSLESGLTGTKYFAIPSKFAAEWKNVDSVELKRISGDGKGFVEVKVVYPPELTGHEYQLGFYSEGYKILGWYLKDTHTGKIIIDSVQYIKGEDFINPIEGLMITVDTPDSLMIDEETKYDYLMTGWWDSIWYDTLKEEWVGRGTGCNYLYSIKTWQLYPYEFELKIGEQGESYDIEGKPANFTIRDRLTGEILPFKYYKDSLPQGLSLNDVIWILNKNEEKILKLEFYIDTTATDTIPPEKGDIFLVKTIKPFLSDDNFSIKTNAYGEKKKEYTLDSVRVVPNPYYIRAPWDKSKYERGIYFQGLPYKCKIRIFDPSGLLIKTIEHDGGGSEFWNLRTEENLDIYSGLYLYQIITEDGKSKIGKFAVIK